MFCSEISPDVSGRSSTGKRTNRSRNDRLPKSGLFAGTTLALPRPAATEGRDYTSGMDHADHVSLLRQGVDGAGLVWADFGAGAGAFTLALADLLGAGGEIHAVDRQRNSLCTNEAAMRQRFPGTAVRYLKADFTQPVELPPLDGIVFANALHFQVEQEAVVRLLRGYLRPGGRLILVEYNIEHGNFAVPYPVPFAIWERMAAGAGFEHTKVLARRPSSFFHEIYSALSW